MAKLKESISQKTIGFHMLQNLLSIFSVFRSHVKLFENFFLLHFNVVIRWPHHLNLCNLIWGAGEQKTSHMRLTIFLSERISFAAQFHGFATPPATHSDRKKTSIGHDVASLTPA